MVRVTPLLAFLRALTADQWKSFLEETGTTVVYLYQLAGQPWPNLKLRRYYVTMHRDQTGELPDLHADKRITSRVYDAAKEIGRKSL